MELLPCPFCGGEAYLCDYEDGRDEMPTDFRCPRCKVCGCDLGYDKIDRAIERWNRRTPQPVTPEDFAAHTHLMEAGSVKISGDSAAVAQAAHLLLISGNGYRPLCKTCNGHGLIGGRGGQTPESYEEWAEPCPDCQPVTPAGGEDPVAWVVIDRQVGNVVNVLLPDCNEHAQRIAAQDPEYFAAQAYLHPPVSDAALVAIGELIRTQDNRITAAPIFAVEQKRWIGGIDPDYGGERVWIYDGEEVTDPDEVAKLDEQYSESYQEPKGYTLTGKVHVWEFVTACFTEQGCKDYIARNGHNLREPRIFAHGSYRNNEWHTVRDYLAALNQRGGGDHG